VKISAKEIEASSAPEALKALSADAPGGAGVLVEKDRTAWVRQNVSGFFDSAPRKIREALRSEFVTFLIYT